MNCDLVIAHYNENISWISKINRSNIRYIFIYTKSNSSILPQSLQDNQKIIHQYSPNIGRESESYLKYCIDKYNDLSDFTLFLQGNPAPHGVDSNKILKWLDIIDKNPEYDYTKNWQTNSIYMGLKNGRRDGWRGPTQPSEYNMTDWFKHYINKTIDPYKAKIYFGACFGIKQTAILSRPIDLYQNIVTNELQTINPEACHYLERAWFYLFNLDLI